MGPSKILLIHLTPLETARRLRHTKLNRKYDSTSCTLAKPNKTDYLFRRTKFYKPILNCELPLNLSLNPTLLFE